MDNKQIIVEQVIQALTKIAITVPEELQMAIAEIISLLAMNGFTQEEIREVEQLIHKIIDEYLDGQLSFPHNKSNPSQLN